MELSLFAVSIKIWLTATVIISNVKPSARKTNRPLTSATTNPATPPDHKTKDGIGGEVFREESRRVSASPKKRRMPERQYSGLTENKAQRQNEQRHDRDARQQAEIARKCQESQ